MVNKKIKNKMVDKLFDSILKVKNRQDLYKLFEDLCTVAEIHSMAQRLAVAKMLSEGLKYSQIVAKTGASTATISRVKRFLEYGADGYRLVLEKNQAKSLPGQRPI